MSRLIYGLLACVCLLFVPTVAKAGDIVRSDFCREFTLAEIPVGEFDRLKMPMAEMRITQKYNTTYAEGWCQVGGAQPSADHPACQDQRVYYGHDGLDLHPLGAQGGQKDIFAIQDGLVIASHKSGAFKGWGESMILATRTNRYSEEIITFHYNHLFRHSGTDLTSRLYNPCEGVPAGEPIAREGGTPNWPTHLHLAVKRWKNLTELQNAIKSPWIIYGQGYVYSNTGILEARFLDPENLLFDRFSEFADDRDSFTSWQWSEQYARIARRRGWFFGEYDGSFGVDKTVKRREAARLTKVAAKIDTITTSTGSGGSAGYFYDVPATDSDFPYINTLSRHPTDLPVINPEATCTGYGHYFCPDREVTRAEAIKMIVVAFFSRDFLEMYDIWLWQNAAPVASNLLSYFTDVGPYTWYAPYVYLAWQKGLIDNSQKKFRPGETVKRAELAKWLVMSRQILDGLPANTFCQKTTCQGGYYCDEKNKACRPIPSCVSQEGETCPLGGGYLLPGADAGYTPVPDAGYPTGTSDSGSQESCSPKGYSQLKICPDNLTATSRMCMYTGYWGEWTPPCPVIQDAGSAGSGGTVSQDAGPDSSAGSGGTEAGGGSGGTGNTGGSTGSGGTANTGGTAGIGGTTGTGGSTGSSGSGGSSTCTTVYKVSPSSGASCHANPQASGSPTLCLELVPPNGPTTSWRLCKQGGAFQNTFSYQLLDQNHLPHNFGGPHSAASGTTCTPWRSASFSYLTQNGSINGAGLIVEVHSPTGCTSQACTYYSGIMTVYRDCQ